MCWDFEHSNKTKGSGVCYHAMKMLSCRSTTSVHNLQTFLLSRIVSFLILVGLYISPRTNTSDGAHAAVRLKSHPSEIVIPTLLLLSWVVSPPYSCSHSAGGIGSPLYLEHRYCTVLCSETRDTELTSKRQFDSINYCFLSTICHVNLYI